MITAKPLLSENVKDFMDYALETIKSMDGAPEHSLEERELVHKKIANLRTYLAIVETSYNETIPKLHDTSTDSAIPFSGTGHS